jgi:hypothetical protein
MAIRDTYAELLLEQIIEAILEDGQLPTTSEIDDRFDAFTTANDISQPVFGAKDHKVSEGDNSSATAYNTINEEIKRDLQVAFRHLFKVSDRSIRSFERWRSESKLIEARLIDLEERISTLLLLSADTAGFFNFVQDNFVDTSKTDLSLTTAYVNVDKQTVTIGTSSAGSTRYDLSELRVKDVQFDVLSKSNLISRVPSEGSDLRYIISDKDNFWQERVFTSKPGPVTGEIKIDLGQEQEISRIDVDLHMSNTNSSVTVVPLLSVDNHNFTQLPISSFSRSVVDKTIFQFTPTTARYIKFLLTKPGFDIVHKSQYVYEFGVDEISFYKEGFAEDDSNVFVSDPLSVTDINGNPEEFSRITLETCEFLPEDTSIDYSVVVGNDPALPVSLTSSVFTPIDPLQRTSPTKPTIVDFGDLDAVTISGIQLSYEAGAADEFTNPSQSFTLITGTNGTSAVTASGHSSGLRYSFFNSNERLLDHAVSSGVQVAQGSLEVWRNVSIPGDNTNVREVSNGWGFSDPYYQTTVYVENQEGVSVDFGGKPVIIDGVATTGKTTISKGRHTVWAHKDNWKVISTATVTDLASLKVADGLYPYNHRYLVEGLVYPSGYPTTDEKIYTGFDIVAEFFMQEVGIFDLINNVPADDYSRFARDLDAADTSRTIDGAADDTSSTTVFVMKIDESKADAINEKFLVKFKGVNSVFKYLRLKADLVTRDSNVAPFLDSYRIKIAN